MEGRDPHCLGWDAPKDKRAAGVLSRPARPSSADRDCNANFAKVSGTDAAAASSNFSPPIGGHAGRLVGKTEIAR
jgi:hypothetical protein